MIKVMMVIYTVNVGQLGSSVISIDSDTQIGYALCIVLKRCSYIGKIISILYLIIVTPWISVGLRYLVKYYRATGNL
jgi:hypothetical protein